jgi:hypothetical protein
MNFVSWKLCVEKKAIIVEILDEDKLHEAMGLASSPFAVIGETPQQSAEIFRTWIINQASRTTIRARRVPIAGSLAWHRLSEDEAEILSCQWRVLRWEIEIEKLELQGFAIVWKMVRDEAGGTFLLVLGSLFYK